MRLLLGLDACILYVFQHLVNALSDWRSHYGLAMLAMCVACGCCTASAGLLLVTDIWWVAPIYGFLTYQWARRAQMYSLLEQYEDQGGRIPPLPVIQIAMLRLFYIACLIVFVLMIDTLTYTLPWMIYVIGWTFLITAHYLAGCRPGTPRRQRVWTPV